MSTISKSLLIQSTFMLLICVGTATHAQTGDPAVGARKAWLCSGCHGVPDYRNAYPAYHVPKLGGQHAQYLVSALHEYKQKQRAHPTMQSIAAGLNDQDMADLAAFFSDTKSKSSLARASGDAEAGKQKSAPCQACHGADGNGTAPQFPRLAGQYPDYLVRALQEYKSGYRKNQIMAPFASKLSDQDMEDIAAYFSGLPNGVVFKPVPF